MSARGAAVRRLGLGAAVATGLALLGMSFGGMATLDGRLQAAAEPPVQERVVIETRDASFTPGDRRCDRERRSPDAT